MNFVANVELEKHLPCLYWDFFLNFIFRFLSLIVLFLAWSAALIPMAAMANRLSRAFLDGMLADGGPWIGTPASLDALQCKLICLLRLNFVVNALSHDSQV